MKLLVPKAAPRRVAGLRSVSRTQVAPSRHPALRSDPRDERLWLRSGGEEGGAGEALATGLFSLAGVP